MAALGSTATVRARGERNPHVGFDEALENRSWAVWYSIRNGKARVKGQARQANGPEQFGLQGETGWVLEINVTTKMKDLWPEFSSLDKTSQNAFASEVRQFLRVSGNAACLVAPGLTTKKDSPQNAGQPVWWVRDEWNDARAVGVFRQTELTRQERKLTAEEAGENRPPAPVEVRKAELTRAEKSRKALEDYQARQRELAPTIRKQRVDKILEVLLEAQYPLYNQEVFELIGGSVPQHAVEQLLRELAEEGTIGRRLETREERPVKYGRFHHLYWFESPVPTRPSETFVLTRSRVNPEANGAPAVAVPEQTPPADSRSEIVVQLERLVEDEVNRRLDDASGVIDSLRAKLEEARAERDVAEAELKAVREKLAKFRSLLGD